jgi:chemotaxis protein histidine kinase CheA
VQATKHQQIVVYFIEEAKEHLDTIEQGLLDLQATMADVERMNEVFRAAHSVKGGAAMLGFSGIQKVGHHLEDGFKLLTENPVTIDQRLEDLFLKGFDLLRELVEDIQSPHGGRPQETEKALQAAEPMFTELQNYLHCLIQNKGMRTACEVIPKAQMTPVPLDPKLPTILNGALRKLLELFKQGDTPVTRQQLVALCGRMAQLHPSPEWKRSLQLAQRAIANPKQPYPVLASVIIKDLKQSSDLLIAGRLSELVPSDRLRQLASDVQTPTARSDAPRSTPANALPNQSLQPNRDLVSPRLSTFPVPAEPRAAARALLEAFNKEQLIELAEYLMKAIQS